MLSNYEEAKAWVYSMFIGLWGDNDENAMLDKTGLTLGTYG